MDWLSRLALLIVPVSWRDTVATDIEAEARSLGRGRSWRAWQTLRAALPIRWTVTGTTAASDIRYATRSLAHARWFTAGAVLTFALGIGVNVAVFSAVDRMLFRHLPYDHPESIVLLQACNPQAVECGGSFPAAVAFHLLHDSRTLSDLAVAGFSSQAAVSLDPDSERLSLVDVSPRTLRVLGVSPIIGRDISESEIASRSNVAWISEEVWRTRFARDPGVPGRTLWLNGKPVSLLGVLPHGFIPPTGSSIDPDWAGLVVAYDPWSTIHETGATLVPFARLRPGATIAAARDEVAAVGRSVASADQSLRIPAEWLRVDGIDQTLFARFQSHLWLIVLAAALVLLIACANLASLLVVRGRSREQVVAVRAALGATRSRLAATAMMESLLMALGGSVVALVSLALTSKALAAALPPVFARYAVGAQDPRVVTFSIGAAAVCAIVTGLAPVWKMRRLEFLALLRTGSRTGREARPRGGRGLLAVEAALGAVLVLGSVLTLRSFAELSHDDLGFAPDGLYVLTAALPRDQQLERHRQVLDVLRHDPSIASIGGADHVPTTSEAPVRGFKTERGSGARIQMTSGYLETLQTPMAAGRTFTENEVATRAPVAVVSRLAARLLFPDTRPEAVIGRTWQAAGEPARLIVGVGDDIKNRYGDPRMEAAVFLPAGTDPSPWVRFVLRARPGVTIAAHQMEEALQSRVGSVRVTLRYVPDALDPSLVDSRFRAVLFSTLALTGLLLAAIGLYSVTSYEVATRRYEMGVRLMLGAAPRDLQRLTLRNACVPVVVGAAAGLLGASWMAILAKSFLYRVDGRDPVAYAVVAVVLVAAALLAAWLPARRAARTDPAEVLRAQ